MSLLSLLFPGVCRKPTYIPPPPKPPIYAEGARVWVASAQCFATVANVSPVAGRWHYSVDLDSHEDCRCVYRESELSLNRTHPYWNPEQLR